MAMATTFCAACVPSIGFVNTPLPCGHKLVAVGAGAPEQCFELFPCKCCIGACYSYLLSGNSQQRQA